MPDLKPTPYFDDFTIYYDKAAILQEYNISSPTGRDPSDPAYHVGDPLMDYVTIYDCVERRYAGFSNALQQIWYGSKNPKRWQIRREFDGLHSVYTPVEWLFLFLIHRLTGSGASFSHDHGFRNSIIADTALKCEQAGEMKRYVLDEMENKRAIFTSIGNQIPAFPKVPSHYQFKSQGRYYISEFVPQLVMDMLDWLTASNQRKTVAEAADWACQWNVEHGAKRFVFVLTAWVMDIAEYFPLWVDPNSHVHYGANAIESLNLLFDYSSFKRSEHKYNAAMEVISEHCRTPFTNEPGRPYSLEDVLCDYVRYIECYVPKGYEHLDLWQVTNASTVRHPIKHRSHHAVKERSVQSSD